MKTIIHITIFVLALISSFSCSDDFLKENKQELYESVDPLILSSQNVNNEITFTIPQAANEKFHISVFPKWLNPEPMNGSFENGILTLKCTIIPPENQIQSDRLTGTLIISVDNVGAFKTEVIYGNIGSIPGQSPANISEIEGTVVDVAYNKATDIMVIATQIPNRLLVNQTSSGTTKAIYLDKSPQCIEIAQDGKTVIVGYTIAEISVFNLENNSPIRSYQLNCVPFDLVLGQNGWCYISPSEVYDFNLRSLNLATGKLDSGKTPPVSHWMYGKSELKKINGKPLLAATRTGGSYGGLILIDISHEIPNDTIAYWNENANNIWPFNDGTRFFATEGQCFFMPEYVASNLIQSGIKTFGKLNISQLRINSIDQCEPKNSFFVAERNVAIMYENVNRDNIIEQFDATNLNHIRTFYPSMTAIKKDGSMVLINNEVGYVFTNKAGTKLFAIRAITTDIDVKRWSIETFDLN